MANIIEIILKAIDETKGGTTSATANLGKLGQTATRIGAGLTVGLTAPLVGVGLASIDMASNFAESLDKVKVVFGENAGEIEAWSENSATAFGMSQQQALEAAGTYGNLFTAMGVGLDETTNMSQGLVGLAADLASFNNIDPTVALEKLRAGLTGEAEPLKALGVNLTAAAVEAKAMEMGLVGANGEISDANLISARYALILEQTALAQGNYAATSDGLANSTRTMKAELADAAVELGTALLPIALQVVQAVSSLVEKFTNMSPAGQKVVLIAGAILAALGPVLGIVGTVISIFTSLAGLFGAGGILAGVGAAVSAAFLPVIAILAAVAGMIIGPILGFKRLVAIIDWVKTQFPGLQEAWGALWESIKTKLGEAWEAITTKLSEAWETIQANVAAAWETLKTKFNEGVEAIKAAFDLDWGALGISIIAGIQAGITSAAAALIATVVGVASDAWSAFQDWIKGRSPSEKFAELGESIPEGVGLGIKRRFSLPINALSGLVPKMAAPFATPSFAGAGGGIHVTVQASVANDIDIERLAYRIADVIQRRRPRR